MVELLNPAKHSLLARSNFLIFWSKERGEKMGVTENHVISCCFTKGCKACCENGYLDE